MEVQIAGGKRDAVAAAAKERGVEEGGGFEMNGERFAEEGPHNGGVCGLSVREDGSI